MNFFGLLLDQKQSFQPALAALLTPSLLATSRCSGIAQAPPWITITGFAFGIWSHWHPVGQEDMSVLGCCNVYTGVTSLTGLTSFGSTAALCLYEMGGGAQCEVLD